MTQNIIDEAVKIPANKRVQLTEILLESVDNVDNTINQKWVNEVKKRMLSVENGETNLMNFVDSYLGKRAEI